MVVIHWCHIKLMYISSDTYMLMHLNLHVQLIEGYLVHMAFIWTSATYPFKIS